MEDNVKNFLLKALGGGATILGGVTYSALDGALDNVSFLSSKQSVNPTGYKNGKFIKTGLMALVGLGVNAAAEFGAPDNEMAAHIGEIVGDWAFGSAAAIYAADPAITAYPPQYQNVNAKTSVVAPVTKILNTGNVFS